MDQLLHRGKYVIKEEEKELEAHADRRKLGRLWRMIGINSHEFSKGDKAIFLFVFLYGIWGLGSVIVLLCLGSTGHMSDKGWLNWWYYGYLCVKLVIGLIAGVWITIFGLLDLRKMYKRLSMIQRDEVDDGRVVEDHTD